MVTTQSNVYVICIIRDVVYVIEGGKQTVPELKPPSISKYTRAQILRVCIAIYKSINSFSVFTAAVYWESPPTAIVLHIINTKLNISCIIFHNIIFSYLSSTLRLFCFTFGFPAATIISVNCRKKLWRWNLHIPQEKSFITLPLPFLEAFDSESAINRWNF